MADILETLDQAWDEDFKSNLMHYCDLAAQEIRKLRKELAANNGHELIGFVAIWAVQYQKDYGLDGLHPTHYDLLKKYGARMDDFKRATNAPEVAT